MYGQGTCRQSGVDNLRTDFSDGLVSNLGSSKAARHCCTTSTQARTACASTPVPRKAPHPAHTATRMCPKNTHKSYLCRVWANAQGCLCCFRRAHQNTMRGSYTGAGIHGHWPAPKTSRKPTPACMYKHGKSARVRWPCVPIEAVCVCIPEIRATWVRRGGNACLLR